MKKIMAIAFILMMFCQICGAAFKAPDPKRWEYLGKTRPPKEVEQWIDLETIEFSSGTSGIIANIWIMFHVLDDDREEKQNFEVNLDKREIRTVDIIIYTTDGNTDRPKIPTDRSNWSKIIPGSIGEDMFNVVTKAYNSLDPKEKKALERQKSGKREHSGGILNAVGTVLGI